eukprot:4014755-Prymnesium_polylepis.1
MIQRYTVTVCYHNVIASSVSTRRRSSDQSAQLTTNAATGRGTQTGHIARRIRAHVSCIRLFAHLGTFAWG